MARRGRWAFAGLALVVLAALGYRAIGTDGGEPAPGTELAVTDDTFPSGAVPTEKASPFDTVVDPDRVEPDVDASTFEANAPEGIASTRAGASGAEPFVVDLQAVGREAMTDADFERLVARLASDPSLLAALIDEFRSETDPERRARLARLLGDVRDPSVSMLAAELIYSGDADSRALGLDLLGRAQAGNEDARGIISGLLSTEGDGEVLVGTLTAMAVPGAVEPGERAELAGQVSLLTNHPDPAVRRTSLDILSRWSDSPEHTPLLLDGLVDVDPIVRRTAAYALVGHEDVSEDVVRDLFAVVENTDEVKRTRRGAILALKGMPLDDERRRRLDDIEQGLNLRSR